MLSNYRACFTVVFFFFFLRFLFSSLSDTRHHQTPVSWARCLIRWKNKHRVEITVTGSRTLSARTLHACQMLHVITVYVACQMAPRCLKLNFNNKHTTTNANVMDFSCYSTTLVLPLLRMVQSGTETPPGGVRSVWFVPDRSAKPQLFHLILYDLLPMLQILALKKKLDGYKMQNVISKALLYKHMIWLQSEKCKHTSFARMTKKLPHCA